MKVFNKLDVARKVWAAVMKKYGTRLNACMSEVCIGAYSNGREQGWRIAAYPKTPNATGRLAVQVSEYRSSDSIVVYAGDMDDPCITEAQREAIYDAKKFAPPGDYAAAAKLVAQAFGL